MKAPLRKFLIREGNGVREADTLVLGTGMLVGETAGGLPELLGVAGGEIVLQPSGGNDTQAVRDALATGRDVRLGPGTFTIGSITLGSGSGSTEKGQWLIGSGVNRTRVNQIGGGEGIEVLASHCGIEGLLLSGTGYNNGQTGLLAVFAAPSPPRGNLTIRNVRFEQMRRAIRLENVSVCTIEDVSVYRTAYEGIYARGVSRGVLRNVDVSGADAYAGIYFESCADIVCELVLIQDCDGHSIHLYGGSGYRLSTVRVQGADSSYPRVLINGNAAGVVVDSLDVSTEYTAISVSQARDVTLNSCRVSGGFYSLVISGSENVVVGAFRSEFTMGRHLAVTNSAGVFVTGMRVVNSATPPTYEVDVSGAGSRVLFGPHNLTPARINSGGNFAAL
jgi:hypothetical protein